MQRQHPPFNIHTCPQNIEPKTSETSVVVTKRVKLYAGLLGSVGIGNTINQSAPIFCFLCPQLQCVCAPPHLPHR